MGEEPLLSTVVQRKRKTVESDPDDHTPVSARGDRSNVIFKNSEFGVAGEKDSDGSSVIAKTDRVMAEATEIMDQTDINEAQSKVSGTFNSARHEQCINVDSLKSLLVEVAKVSWEKITELENKLEAKEEEVAQVSNKLEEWGNSLMDRWKKIQETFGHLNLRGVDYDNSETSKAPKSSIEMVENNYEEELKKERRLVCSLLYELDCRKQRLSEMEHKYNVTTATLEGLIGDLIAKITSKDCSLRDWELRYNVTMRQLKAKNIMLLKEIRKEKAENFKLRQSTRELKDCKCQNDKDPEQRSLSNETEVPKEDVACRNLVELEKTLSEQIAGLKKELEETSEALTDMESRYICMTVKHELTNRELQDARKESISGLNDFLNSRTTLGVKKMGEIDQKAFIVACSAKFPNDDWQEISAKSCSLWQQNVQDPKWYPFKMVNVHGNLQEIVDEDDEKLKELRSEYGDAAFEAVSTALMEMNEYNASGRYPVPEVWNRKEDRKASMKEIIEYVIKQLKIHKPKRKRAL